MTFDQKQTRNRDREGEKNIQNILNEHFFYLGSFSQIAKNHRSIWWITGSKETRLFGDHDDGKTLRNILCVCFENFVSVYFIWTRYQLKCHLVGWFEFFQLKRPYNSKGKRAHTHGHMHIATPKVDPNENPARENIFNISVNYIKSTFNYALFSLRLTT